jgi:hypothetical protein
VYPVAIAYSSGAAAYIGDMTFAQSLGAIARAHDLHVHIELLAPLDPRGMERRQLAARACSLVRARLVGLQLRASPARAFSEPDAAPATLPR